MSIESRRQLENTRAKLQKMEQLYEELRQEPAENDHVRKLTLRSLQKRINQFTEEILRFKCHVRTVQLGKTAQVSLGPAGKVRQGSAMIPELNEAGYLPPGIHPATLEEVAARFG